MNVFWFLPTHGDSRYLGTNEGARAVDYEYLRQVAAASDTLGYDGVLLPTGRSCEDAWVVASSLIGATRNLKFLVAIRPGISSPGLFATHDERYEITDEFLRIWRGTLERAHAQAAFDFAGSRLKVKGSRVLMPSLQKPYPPLYFGGSSAAAHELAAEQVDVYLTWGEPPAAVGEKIARIGSSSCRTGRSACIIPG